MTPELLELTLRAAAEAALIAVAFWLILSPLGAGHHLAKLGPARIAAVSGLLVLWIAVQLADRGQYYYPQPTSYYPAARFAMYDAGERREVVRSYRLEATFPDGRSSEIDLTDYFPSIDAASLDSRMQAVSAGLQSRDPKVAMRAARELAGFVSGVRSILRAEAEPLPVHVTFRATRHRISDRAVVYDTLLWSATYDELTR